MSIYKIKDIIEADYGCEEHNDGPHAILVFENDDKLEVTEKWIAEQGIKEGKVIWIPEPQKMIFATQRGYGELKDGWEFPGGKIEARETPEEAIVREIKEELDTLIKVEKYVDTIEYDYPEFHLSMDCFLCSVVEGDLVLKEHEAARWLTKETIDSVDWLPADVTILDKVRDLL